MSKIILRYKSNEINIDNIYTIDISSIDYEVKENIALLYAYAAIIEMRKEGVDFNSIPRIPLEEFREEANVSFFLNEGALSYPHNKDLYPEVSKEFKSIEQYCVVVACRYMPLQKKIEFFIRGFKGEEVTIPARINNNRVNLLKRFYQLQVKVEILESFTVVTSSVETAEELGLLTQKTVVLLVPSSTEDKMDLSIYQRGELTIDIEKLKIQAETKDLNWRMDKGVIKADSVFTNVDFLNGLAKALSRSTLLKKLFSEVDI